MHIVSKLEIPLLDSEKRILLEPCGHICVCLACSSHTGLRKCPVCRLEIKKRHEAFF
jgi:hypothetical protein